MAGTELKGRPLRFALAYLEKPIGAHAAIAAGYGEKYAAERAVELLNRPDVKTYLAERTGKLLVVNDATVERITRELAAIGFADLTSIFVDSPDGPRLRPLREWPAEIRQCIASIETTRQATRIKAVAGDEPGEPESLVETAEIVTKIKLWPKVQALELLARYRKMLDAGAGDPSAPRQVFVGMQVTVAPGAQANIQVVAPTAPKGGT